MSINIKPHATHYSVHLLAGTVQSGKQLTMGWAVWGSNPGGGEIFMLVQIGPGAHPTSYTMGTGSLSWKQSS